MTKYSSEDEDSEGESSEHSSSDEEDNLLMSKLKEDLDELKALKLVLLEVERLELSRDNEELLLKKFNLLRKSYDSLILNSQKKKSASAINIEEEYEDETNCKSICGKSLDKGNLLIIDDSDGDDDFRACFPCPFCYVDIEVHGLCSHLQDEHCFDLKNAVCPLCAANLGKDVIGHFIVQHASSLKHRRKSQKAGLWTSNLAMLGKELSSFLGSSTNGSVNTHEVVPDPLLSPFLSNVSHSEPKGTQKDESLVGKAYLTSQSKSAEMSSVGANELDYEERERRAAFVQQLIASTIF